MDIEINEENLDKIFQIELLEQIHCQSKKEMLATKEEHLSKHQGDNKCLNNIILMRKIKQMGENLLKRIEKERKDYYENKVKHQEKQKKYRETHNINFCPKYNRCLYNRNYVFYIPHTL